MNAIPGDWSLALLLLFGGASTALTAWAAVLLAEIWSQKIRQRREHFKAWQEGRLKMWQDRQRESFLSLSSDQEEAQSRSKTGAGSVRIENTSIRPECDPKKAQGLSGRPKRLAPHE
jgi:hypothetical protein